jgi:hypothetical protein
MTTKKPVVTVPPPSEGVGEAPTSIALATEANMANPETKPEMVVKPAAGEQLQDPRVDQALGIFANLSALEVTPSTQIAAREILSVVPVRKPKNNEFVRVNPAASLTTIVFEDKDANETYFVDPAIRSMMIAGAAIKMLTLAVNQAGAIFIWPVPVDDQSSRANKWNESARAGYQQAKTNWVKLVGDRAAGLYRIYLAEGELPPPRWPNKSFEELLAIAFSNRRIDREDHPILREMYGRGSTK